MLCNKNIHLGPQPPLMHAYIRATATLDATLDACIHKDILLKTSSNAMQCNALQCKIQCLVHATPLIDAHT